MHVVLFSFCWIYIINDIELRWSFATATKEGIKLKIIRFFNSVCFVLVIKWGKPFIKKSDSLEGLGHQLSWCLIVRPPTPSSLFIPSIWHLTLLTITDCSSVCTTAGTAYFLAGQQWQRSNFGLHNFRDRILLASFHLGEHRQCLSLICFCSVPCHIYLIVCSSCMQHSFLNRVSFFFSKGQIPGFN